MYIYIHIYIYILYICFIYIYYILFSQNTKWKRTSTLNKWKFENINKFFTRSFCVGFEVPTITLSQLCHYSELYIKFILYAYITSYFNILYIDRYMVFLWRINKRCHGEAETAFKESNTIVTNLTWCEGNLESHTSSV